MQHVHAQFPECVGGREGGKGGGATLMWIYRLATMTADLLFVFASWVHAKRVLGWFLRLLFPCLSVSLSVHLHLS